LPSPHWHVRHFLNPADTSPGSIMPPYPHLLEKPLDFAQAERSVAAMRALGVPYAEQTVADAARLARVQADEIAAKVVAENGPAGLGERKVVALVAYLMRLGTDLDKPVGAPASMPGPAGDVTAAAAGVATTATPVVEQGGGQ
jgi:cytochrome c oxidase cbb3-type subunit I/II